MTFALLAVGFGVVALWKAADEFVAGATRLALIFKISPVIVGAVIVGFGTSAPELLVSSIAAVGGDIDVGVGNVIGSNIANLSLILGAAALVVPITITSGVIKREAPLSVASVLLFAILVQFDLGTLAGIVLLVVLGFSLWIIITSGDSAELSSEVEELAGDGQYTAAREIVRTLVGMVLTIGGAWILVWGALELADLWGLSGGFIGVTLVAIGTSLPELVTAVAAARAGQTELIVGNLLGSNLFNSLAVGGAVGIFGSGAIQDQSLASVGVGFMLLVAVGAFLTMRTRGRFQRIEGSLLIVLFFVFLGVTYWLETT